MTDFSTPLEPGTRVRNRGEQYPRAYEHGTHEYRVLRDDGTEASWNYVYPVTPRG